MGEAVRTGNSGPSWRGSLLQKSSREPGSRQPHLRSMFAKATRPPKGAAQFLCIFHSANDGRGEELWDTFDLTPRWSPDGMECWQEWYNQAPVNAEADMADSLSS